MLELRELTRRFGDVVALDNASFVIRAGEAVGFIVLGLLAADHGEVRWNDVAIDRAARQRIGYMPEERGLYAKARVIDQLTYFSQLAGYDRPSARVQAKELLTRLGSPERASDKLEKLSLGNQQRVQLAAALVGRPDMLVLDEPFSGLDPVGVDTLAGEIEAALASGVGVLFSSHQLELVERLCDRVVMIEHGRIVRNEVVRMIDERSAIRFTVALTDRANGGADLRSTFADQRGVSRVDHLASTANSNDTGEADRSVTLLVHVDTTADPQFLLGLAQCAGSIIHFGFETPSLADRFRQSIDFTPTSDASPTEITGAGQ